jgi:cyclic-di-GMP-binding protein
MNSRPPLREVETWLTLSAGLPPTEEILAVRRHLATVATEPAGSPVRQQLLEGLHMRTTGVIEALTPRLYNVRLPISTNTRRAVKSMQEALETLASLGLETVESPDSQLGKGPGTPSDLALWRIFEALAQHLMLANLIAAPASQGTWHSLHRTYVCARRHLAEGNKPTGTHLDLQTLYARTLICGSISPAALSAHEWAFLHRFVAQTHSPLEVTDTADADSSAFTLWASPDQDLPPTLLERRPPGEDMFAFFVNCHGIVSEVELAMHQLAANRLLPDFLPKDTSARTARVALGRLHGQLSLAKKRRFPRRRQAYRSTLCIGFDEICKLLRTGIESDVLTAWMIVNESPGGYAAMHLAGRPRKVQVGDLVALRRDGDTRWSISVIRWALSENPEHLELGLEELSPRAISGCIATPGRHSENQPLALLLPALPPFRDFEALVLLPSSRQASEGDFIFVGDGDTNRIREFRFGDRIEQSSGVDVWLMRPNGP